MKKDSWRRSLLPLLLTALMLAGFSVQFYADNKYQTPPPYGRSGVLELSEADVLREDPIFLIDGWLLSDCRVSDLPTYIGQFSSLRRGTRGASPHGSASYELTLRYRGEPLTAAISFPQLFSQHRILFDGLVLSEGMGGTRVAISLTEGDHLLRVETTSSRGYYSGMYHPAALGTMESISNLLLIQCIAYCLAFFAPLVLAAFTLALWFGSKDRAAFWFGLLCCCFSGYISYYFVRLLSSPLGEHWYLIQAASLYGLFCCVLRLTALAGNVADQKIVRLLQRIAVAFSLTLLALALVIPFLREATWLHSVLTDLFYFFTFFSLLYLMRCGRNASGWERRLTQMGCVCFGIGLLYNLLSSQMLSSHFLARNLFEPIHFFWQFEWCVMLLVTLFGAVMVARNRRILTENTAFQSHLEEMVQQRTSDLRNLLQERKAFFADMAHDLKAPIFAASAFIQEIRAHDTGVDGELLHYIDLVEQKQREMLGRVQGLTVFNRMDEQSEPYASIPVQTFMSELEQNYLATTQVQAVYFTVVPPDRDGFIYAQPRKLEILFENLIFNALRATPPEGSITVTGEVDDGGCHLSVADTGCGIAPEDLPRIFDRFFVGAQNEGTGSGLGLYIVKCIVDELRGEISVSSKPGQGAVFYIDLPLHH